MPQPHTVPQIKSVDTAAVVVTAPVYVPQHIPVQHQSNHKPQLTSNRQTQSLTALASNSSTILQTAVAHADINKPEPVAINEPPLPTSSFDAADGKKSPTVHLTPVNIPAVNLLKEGIEQRIDQARSLTHSLKETSLAIRIGNKNHYLNF
jgi:hypothetical protein